jgi:hypothetical protein
MSYEMGRRFRRAAGVLAAVLFFPAAAALAQDDGAEPLDEPSSVSEAEPPAGGDAFDELEALIAGGDDGEAGGAGGMEGMENYPEFEDEPQGAAGGGMAQEEGQDADGQDVAEADPYDPFPTDDDPYGFEDEGDPTLSRDLDDSTLGGTVEAARQAADEMDNPPEPEPSPAARSESKDAKGGAGAQAPAKEAAAPAKGAAGGEGEGAGATDGARASGWEAAFDDPQSKAVFDAFEASLGLDAAESGSGSDSR